MKRGLIFALLLVLCCVPLAHAEVTYLKALKWQHALPEAARKDLEEMLQEAGYEGLVFEAQTVTDDIFPRYALRISDNILFVQRVTADGRLFTASVSVKQAETTVFPYEEAEQMSRLFIRSFYPTLTDEDAGLVLTWLSKDLPKSIDAAQVRSVEAPIGSASLVLHAGQGVFTLRLEDMATGFAEVEAFRAKQIVQ